MNETELAGRLRTELAHVRFTPGAGEILRRGRRRRQLRAAPLGALAAAAALTAALVGGHGGAQQAFAGWHDEPEPVPPATYATLAMGCRANGDDPSATPLAVDLRGDGALTVMASARSWTSCIATRRHHDPANWASDPDWFSISRGSALVHERPSASKPLVVMDAKAPEAGGGRGGKHVTWVSGRVSPRVAHVEVRTSLGGVRATLRDGVFAAFWPANDGAHASVLALDASGRVVARADRLDCVPSGQRGPGVVRPGGKATGC
jgi:hypothetical protein